MHVSRVSRLRVIRVCRAVALLILLAFLSGAALPPPSPDKPWVWPFDGSRHVVTPFRAPAHDYGPGHRGIDLAATIGSVVLAPADGVVAFRGVVVNRPLLTIDHGEGLVTTFEPVDSSLAPGTMVNAGDDIGRVVTGGHTPANQLHLGVRWNSVYINPMLMFADVPRAILLPCCAAIAVTRADAPGGMSP